jgi:hypothetical protein
MFTRKGIISSLSIPLSVGLLCIGFAPQARASEWNQRTQVTFNAPVEVPGRVLLPGTYTFQLMNSTSNRHIVEIFNKNRTRLEAIALTDAAYRMNTTGKPVVTLEERPADAPMAVHKWFYPGDHYGQDFIYGFHSKPVEVAMAHMPMRTGRPGTSATNAK